MAYRLYIVPVIMAGPWGTTRYPKYFQGLNWGGMDYGFQPTFLVAADLPAATDASIIANPDVTEFPFNLDTTLQGGQVQAARDALEAALIPAQWVNAQDSWREVARMVAGMFQFMQRLNFYLGNTVLIDDSTKLNVQWSAVPPDTKTAILNTANDFGYSTAFIQNNTQMRVILEVFAGAWGDAPFNIGGFIF